ncbi:MAG TPA: glutathione S-transferase family protein [Burkholderiales bacterium]|nr:glutathione S-transferase family protein [Burkholderiales bacterium]
MALTFYYGSGSPYAWRVWLALEYKQVPFEQKTLSFSSGDLRQPAYLAVNPRGKVPAIVDGSFTLYESVAIVEYLDEQYRGPSLFPGSPAQRAVVRRMVQESDQYYASAMERLVDQILFTPQEQWDLQRIAKARASLADELMRWEKLVLGDFLSGPVLSAADFTLYPLIALTQRMQRRKADLDTPSMIGPKVSAWMKRIEALPYFERTLPPHWK